MLKIIMLKDHDVLPSLTLVEGKMPHLYGREVREKIISKGRRVLTIF